MFVTTGSLWVAIRPRCARFAMLFSRSCTAFTGGAMVFTFCTVRWGALPSFQSVPACFVTFVHCCATAFHCVSPLLSKLFSDGRCSPLSPCCTPHQFPLLCRRLFHDFSRFSSFESVTHRSSPETSAETSSKRSWVIGLATPVPNRGTHRPQEFLIRVGDYATPR